MALIICKECSNKFSDLAPACPKCGAPTSYSKHNVISFEDQILNTSVEASQNRDLVQPHLQQININIPEPKEPPKQIRYIGSLLLVGVFFFPVIFYWFLLRDGHTIFSRVFGFIWLIVSTLSFMFFTTNSYNHYIEKSKQSRASHEEAAPTVFYDIETEIKKQKINSIQLDEQEYTLNEIPNITNNVAISATDNTTTSLDTMPMNIQTPHENNEGHLTLLTLTECLNSEAEEEGYTYKDGGESAANMLEACQSSYTIWREQCMFSIDNEGTCNINAMGLAQNALISVGK